MSRVVACLVLLLAMAAPAQAQARPQELAIQRAGTAMEQVSAEDLAQIVPLTQRVPFATSHGAGESEWTGPTLWDVLVATKLIDPAKPAEAVHLVVRVTGSDGYVAVLAAGELSPEFAGRKVQLALRQNGKALALPRLVVPGEKRGGRSVRDVVRIDVNG
jgi:hypothetical protein